nr:hypothetical protein [Tanacetum cinerariifolium]
RTQKYSSCSDLSDPPYHSPSLADPTPALPSIATPSPPSTPLTIAATHRQPHQRKGVFDWFILKTKGAFVCGGSSMGGVAAVQQQGAAVQQP